MTGILTVMILPTRLVMIVALCVFAWLLAVVGLLGLPEDEIVVKPFTGWRRKLKRILANIMCLACACGGMSIVVKGKQADRSEAPILVIAPHSSFLDAVILYVTGFPTVICRKESGTNPWLGKILAYSQPIMVSREDHDSRQKTIQQIIERVKSKDFTSQVLIFPEGTCTNRSCLITFKPGAFYPGLPVQPVLMRYPNKLDTVTWTWEGPGIYKLLWLTLVQTQFTCEIEFLPVYKPSEAEKKDPKLYADNVRQHMAKILGVPTMDYTYNDCKLVSKAKRLSYSKNSPLLSAHQIRIKLGLSRNQIEEKLLNKDPSLLQGGQLLVNYPQFCQLLDLNMKDPMAKDLFKLFERDSTDYIDMKEYLLSIVLVNKSDTKREMISQAFKLCGGSLTKYDLIVLLGLITQLDENDILRIFDEIDVQHKGSITEEQFEEYASNSGEFDSIFGRSLRRLSFPKDNDDKCK
ncbi:lysophosphatidylcholine acyltransferase 1 isoform X2 [Cimex lectularius]|uniref:EF-hand domain-containing protein n=1 Tax=Cimex lectularius TaxID=79782 RepID=A0A8I6SHQ4_CIMLE|nr:lysophosphatidylcholine acyltransferase 1 isoform X2 [Cimex lectularius]